METMGFEPTTPCLQTVQLGACDACDLDRRLAGSAWSRPGWSGRVARAWPGHGESLRVFVRAVEVDGHGGPVTVRSDLVIEHDVLHLDRTEPLD